MVYLSKVARIAVQKVVMYSSHLRTTGSLLNLPAHFLNDCVRDVIFAPNDTISVQKRTDAKYVGRD